jgi:minor ampullate spidroin-like protein (fragment)
MENRMDGMNIVAGDLESLAQSSACVAEDIVAKKVGTAFGDASSAMPGSESSKLISETGDSVDKRIKDLSDRYTDFTEKVKASLYEYQQNEGDIQGAMGSVGSSCPSMSGAGGAAAGAAVGAAAGKIANRMGGAAAGVAAGVAAGAADHSYGSVVGGSDGHSYGSVVGGSGGHSYGDVVAGSDGHSYGGAAAGAAAGVAGHSYGTTTNGSTDGFLGYGSPGSGDPGVSGESDMSFNHYGIPGNRVSEPLLESGLISGSDGPVVEPIPTSPGDYSIDPIPNADPSGPVIENLSATNEGTA